MTKTYVLIDLQNKRPQPSNIAAWIGNEGEAWIFYGEQELGLLAPYFEIGPQVSIVPISRPGNNSLDFHLIMYLGYLIAKRAGRCRFIVVANDRDYDPAVDHAQSEGIDVVRFAELPETPHTITESPTPVARSDSLLESAPSLRPKMADAPKSKKARTSIAVYAGILRDIKLNRPRDLQALRSRIRSRLGRDTPERVAQVLEHLATMDVIRIDGEALTYLD